MPGVPGGFPAFELIPSVARISSTRPRSIGCRFSRRPSATLSATGSAASGLALGLGGSSTRLMPSVGSGRYPPGPGREMLPEGGSYQEIRRMMAESSQVRPEFLAKDSFFMT